MFKKLFILATFLLAGAAMAAVDINKATESELDGLSGIGPATTQLILSERKKGEFKDWSDVMRRIKGIGKARAANLSASGLTVGGSSYSDQASKTTAKPTAYKTPTMTPAAVKPADKNTVERHPANAPASK